MLVKKKLLSKRRDIESLYRQTIALQIITFIGSVILLVFSSLVHNKGASTSLLYFSVIYFMMTIFGFLRMLTCKKALSILDKWEKDERSNEEIKP